MDAISNDDIREISIQKAKRLGYTKMLGAAIGYFSAYKVRSGVVYLPIDSDAADWVRDELDPMLRDCPEVRNALRADPEKKSRHSTRSEKHFIGATLDVKGGKSERNYRQLTKDFVIYDELDAFEPEVGKGGDAVTLGDGRIETSLFAKSVRGSTPLNKAESHIEALVEEADVVFERYVRCLHCAELHTLKWARFVWHESDPETVRHVCPHCGAAQENADLGEMDERGEWRETLDPDPAEPGDDEGGGVEEDLEEDLVGGGRRLADGGVVVSAEGEPVEVVHVAFRMWSGLSYWKGWARIVLEFLRAKRRADVGDLAPLKTWTTTVLGETWTEEAEQVEADPLLVRREHYTPESIPAAVRLLTAAVDVQGSWIEVEVVGWAPGEESFGIETRRFLGDPSTAERGVDVWKDLDEFLLAPRYREDGVALPIGVTLVDSGYLADTVYAFCHARRRRRVLAIKGRGVERERPIIGLPSEVKTPRVTTSLHIVGSHAAKLAVLGHLQVTTPGPGYCHFGPESSGYTREWFEGLTSERLVTRRRRGRRVLEWEQGVRRNEPFDLRCYNVAALYLLRPKWLTARAPAPAEEVPVAAAERAKSENPPPVFRRKQATRPRDNAIMNWRGR